MKTSVRYTISAFLLAAMAAGLTFLLQTTKQERSMMTCTGVQVEFLDDYRFVSEDDVKQALERHYGTYIGQRVDSVRLDQMESIIEKNGVIRKGEVWATSDGIIHVSVTQRAPVVRFQRGEKGFYMDEEGITFPLHSSYTAEVRTVSGDIPSIEDGANRSWARGMLSLIGYIDSSKAWRDRISSINVNTDGDIELKVGEGRERFIFGAPEDFATKFDKMEKYFSYIATGAEDAPKYKSVNLKYNKQLICRKDI